AIGYHPEVILAGRKTNDGMGRYVASQMIKAMLKKGIQVKGSKVLIMGFAFKENCPDLRNTRVVDVVNELEEYLVDVDVYDPWVSYEEAECEYGIRPVSKLKKAEYNGVVIAVSHGVFREMGMDAIAELLCSQDGVIYDLKYIFPNG